jgi:hypothetical protein
MMTKSDKIGVILLGAAAGMALLKYYNMPYEEKQEFKAHLTNRAHDLLDEAEDTMDTVKQHFAEMDSKAPNAWVDKLFVFKRLLTTLFGSERRYLI